MKTIAVIGGGITGVTTAYALVKRGFAVTLIERNRYPAMETSFANGGQLSVSNAEVWNHWHTVACGLKWMLRRDAPLLVRPAPGWHKLSWFAEFLAAIPQYRNNTIATTRMALAAREHLFSWAAQENIDFDLKQKGILHFYRHQASYARATALSRLLGEGGLAQRAVCPDEIRVIEPTLAGNYYGGYFTDSDASGDIHKFTVGLEAACQRLGAVCLYGNSVDTLQPDGKGVLVGAGDMRAHFDGVVICAGSASRVLAAALGDRVNVYPVKGYSITIDLADQHSQDNAPQVSLLDHETRLVASRLGKARLRVAGTAEFAGSNRDIRADRIAPLVDWVEQCFPHVKTRHVIPWTGLRPTMPNMMPRVGPGRRPGVYYNTGHGHLGWTLAAATADMTATLIANACATGATRASVPARPQ